LFTSLFDLIFARRRRQRRLPFARARRSCVGMGKVAIAPPKPDCVVGLGWRPEDHDDRGNTARAAARRQLASIPIRDAVRYLKGARRSPSRAFEDRKDLFALLTTEPNAEVNVASGRTLPSAPLPGIQVRTPMRGKAMPLSSHLRQVELTLQCKHCGHSIIKKGSWFKVALFNRHARLSQPELKSRVG